MGTQRCILRVEPLLRFAAFHSQSKVSFIAISLVWPLRVRNLHFLKSSEIYSYGCVETLFHSQISPFQDIRYIIYKSSSQIFHKAKMQVNLEFTTKTKFLWEFFSANIYILGWIQLDFFSISHSYPPYHNFCSTQLAFIAFWWSKWTISFLFHHWKRWLNSTH